MKILASLVVFSAILCVHQCNGMANGTHVNIKDVKWVVALVDEKMEDIVCTAALIELDWAITAAQCVERFGIFDVLYILAGIDTTENKKVAEKSYVMYWHIHPCYVNKNAYDIALMKLSFKISGSVAGPIELSAEPWPEDEMYERECSSAGWGTNMVTAHTINGTEIDILRQSTFTTGHGPYGCPCTMRNDQKRLVCSTVGGQALCFGDFGGVLVCKGRAVAVAHDLMYGNCNDETVSDCRKKKVISKYVFICPFLSWIKRYVPSVPDKPESCFSPSLVLNCALLICSEIILGGFWRIFYEKFK